MLQLERAHDQIVVPLENFRTNRIGNVKDNKKKFDKKTAKFCKAQELFLNMSSKKPDNTIQEVSTQFNISNQNLPLQPLANAFFIVTFSRLSANAV